VSFSVGSFHVSDRIRSGHLLGNLMSGHFEFQVYQVGSGQLSGHLVSGYFIFQVVSGRVGYRVI
jgi:hypothetical protein